MIKLIAEQREKIAELNEKCESLKESHKPTNYVHEDDTSSDYNILNTLLDLSSHSVQQQEPSVSSASKSSPLRASKRVKFASTTVSQESSQDTAITSSPPLNTRSKRKPQALVSSSSKLVKRKVRFQADLMDLQKMLAIRNYQIQADVRNALAGKLEGDITEILAPFAHLETCGNELRVAFVKQFAENLVSGLAIHKSVKATVHLCKAIYYSTFTMTNEKRYRDTDGCFQILATLMRDKIKEPDVMKV